MKMLVTKLSKGKYANEGQLFAEVISDDNVKLMGEMIALQALRNVMPYDFEVVNKLYNGLVKDLNRLSEIDYTITDGYDYAQTAICFLYQFKGMYVNDIYGKDKTGKYISIKTACYRAVDKELWTKNFCTSAEKLRITDNWNSPITSTTFPIRATALKIKVKITQKPINCSKIYTSQNPKLRRSTVT